MIRQKSNPGFTLLELMVTVAIIGILSAVVYANFGTAGAKGRDAQRQADLKELQIAIEAYKAKYGRYPEQGCGSTGTSFATEAGCAGSYILGATGRLFSEFVPKLPRDLRRGSGTGFAYLTNTNGTVYKAMVMSTVESEIVTDAHPLKSCDISHTVNNASPNLNLAGWCSRVHFSDNNVPVHCEATNNRFRTSYSVWGGFAPLIGGDMVGNATDVARVRDTTSIICR